MFGVGWGKGRRGMFFWYAGTKKNKGFVGFIVFLLKGFLEGGEGLCWMGGEAFPSSQTQSTPGR